MFPLRKVKKFYFDKLKNNYLFFKFSLYYEFIGCFEKGLWRFSSFRM